MQRVAMVCLGAAAAIVAPSRNGTPAGPKQPGAACAAAEYRQFDFFVGDWDGYDSTGPTTMTARNRVTIILDGCVVHEVYGQSDGLRGESFSTYDPARRMWHQTWVTNRGGLLLLDGRLEGGRMVLTGPERTADGTPSQLRGVWEVQGKSVHEVAERSKDGGRTWEPVFDILFRPHRRGASG